MTVENVSYDRPEDIPSVIPLFPLPTILLLPKGLLPLSIFEPRYVEMINDSMNGEHLIGVVQPKKVPKMGESDENIPVFSIGCVGQITEIKETGDDRYFINLNGISRFRILQEVLSDNKYRMAKITTQEFQDDFVSDVSFRSVDRQKLLETLQKFLELKGLEIDWKNVDAIPTESLINVLSMMSPFELQDKQALLETPNLLERANTLIAITEIELAKNSSSSETTIQ